MTTLRFTPLRVSIVLVVAIAWWSAASRGDDGPVVAEVPAAIADFPFLLGDDVLAARRAEREADAQILRKLSGDPISGEIRARPLAEAAAAVCRQAGIENVWIDEALLKEEGVAPDVPVSVVYRHSSPHQALKRLLAPIGLAYMVQNGRVRITTETRAEEGLTARQYNVRAARRAFGEALKCVRDGVLDPSGDPSLDGHPDDARGLVHLIQSETRGLWQDVHGAGGRVTVLGDRLLVWQTERGHRDVAALLEVLERLIASPPGRTASPLLLTPREANQARGLRERMARHAGSLEFDAIPLGDVLGKLSRLVDGPIVLDERALEEEGIALDVPITFREDRRTAAAALAAMIEPHGLTATIEDGAVVVTTQVKADEDRHSVAYDVRDLMTAGVSGEVLREILIADAAGAWQETHGSGGDALASLPGFLFVRQTRQSHEHVADLLGVLRDEVAKSGATATAARAKRAAPAMLVTRLYPLDRKGLAAQMVGTIAETVAADSWDGAGGRGTIRRIDETLVIKQTVPVHRAIQRFLDEFRNAENRAAGTGGIAPPRGF